MLESDTILLKRRRRRKCCMSLCVFWNVEESGDESASEWGDGEN